ERWKLLASKESTTAVSAAALVALVLDFEAARSRPTRSSLAFSTSVLDRKEAARLEHFMVSLATGQEPPWLTPYLRKLGPAFAAANQVAAVAGPFLYQFYAGLYKIYKALPQNAACGLWGLGACFFGGRYAAFFAAAEAFKTAGGDQMLVCLQDLQADLVSVLQAQEDEDEASLSGEKKASKTLALVMRTVDPGRLSMALSGVWAGYMGVVLALKYNFARTLAFAHSIGDNLRPVAAKLLAPTALSVTPPEYRQWVGPAINLGCKCVAMAVAWKLQQVVSSVQSSISGGLLASRCFLPYLMSSGLLASRNLEDTMIDEILGWGLASAGMYFQIIKGGSVPLLLAPILWPMGVAESWLQWSVTWLGSE
ncbi:unnamed protein product, partial [Polarella glacialis]